jgi:phage portal protein BeeE
VLGLSPVAYHAETIGLGLTARKFGADYLGDGGHPSALIQPEGNIGTEQATALKERFMALTRGNREPIVIPQSTKYTPIQVKPEESQFLSTMQYTANEIISLVFLEDPADYGASAASGSSLTYANRSDADLARFKRRQFWVTKLQKALTDLVPAPVTVRLNTSSALMMTATERHTLHKLRLDSHTQTVNGVRLIEDEPPFPGPEFDQPGIPQLPQGGDV